MRRVPRPCSQCGARVMKAGLCARHYKQRDLRRGTPSERGYDKAHRHFRALVLQAAQNHCAVPTCDTEPTVADHYPHTRKELVAMGLDPNDPRYGRALCTYHHNQYTATQQSHLGTA